MPSQGSDFDQLRRAAQQQDAAKQVQLAKEREKQDREAAQRRAAEDAKAKQERERNREMLKKREEIRQRRQEEEAKLAAQRQEWKRQQAEKASKAAREAVRNAAARPESKSSDKVVTKKMIRDRESIGLGRSSSGKATSSRSRGEGTSSFESVPLTRQEKRDRKNREALGLTGKGVKALMGANSTKKASQMPGTSAANRLNASMVVPTSVRDATGTQPRTTVSKNSSSAGSAPQQSSSKRIQSLERDLKQLTAFRERLLAAPQSKENDLKLRNTEAAEREAKRSIAMERKREEQAQLARIKAGLPPLPAAADAASERSDRDVRGVKRGREDEDGSKGPSAPSRPETARERFLREEQERKAKAKADKAAGIASKKSMRYEEDEDDEDDEDEEDEESLDDFIDDEDPDEEQQDIWSMINPGKERPKYMNTSRDDDDDDDDDMEADIDSMTREELRSSRAGREEDKREEAELNRRAREKALLKQKRGLGR
ncbi:unnamed protein product [Jaminaea pallidilutea]